jgi:hypothetical protein
MLARDKHSSLFGLVISAEEKKFSNIDFRCPIEIDKLPLGNKRALMGKAEDYTVFIKNSIAFPYFGHEFVRNNLVKNL